MEKVYSVTVTNNEIEALKVVARLLGDLGDSKALARSGDVKFAFTNEEADVEIINKAIRLIADDSARFKSL